MQPTKDSSSTSDRDPEVPGIHLLPADEEEGMTLQYITSEKNTDLPVTCIPQDLYQNATDRCIYWKQSVWLQTAAAKHTPNGTRRQQDCLGCAVVQVVLVWEGWVEADWAGLAISKPIGGEARQLQGDRSSAWSPSLHLLYNLRLLNVQHFQQMWEDKELHGVTFWDKFNLWVGGFGTDTRIELLSLQQALVHPSESKSLWRPGVFWVSVSGSS